MDNKSGNPFPPERADDLEQDSGSPFDILGDVQFGGQDDDSLGRQAEADKHAQRYEDLRKEKDERAQRLEEYESTQTIPFKPDTHNERAAQADVELGRYLSLIDPSQQEAIAFVKEPGVVDFLNDTQIAGYSPIKDDMIPALRASFEEWKGKQEDSSSEADAPSSENDAPSSEIDSSSDDASIDRALGHIEEHDRLLKDSDYMDSLKSKSIEDLRKGNIIGARQELERRARELDNAPTETGADDSKDETENSDSSEQYRKTLLGELTSDAGVKWLAENRPGTTPEDLEKMDDLQLMDIYLDYDTAATQSLIDRQDALEQLNNLNNNSAEGETGTGTDSAEQPAEQTVEQPAVTGDPDVITSSEQGGTTENGSESGDGGSNNEPSDESTETTEGHTETLEELQEVRKQNLLQFLSEPHRADWLAQKHRLTVDDIKDRDVDEIQALWDEYLDDALSSDLNNNSDENAGEGATGENGGGSEEQGENAESQENAERTKALELLSGDAAEWLGQNHSEISADNLEDMSDDELQALISEYQGSLKNEESEEGAPEDESASEDDEAGDEEEEESAGSESGEEEEASAEDEDEEESSAEDEESETNFERENALEAFSGEAAEWLAQNHGDISAEDLEAMSDEDLEALWNEYQSSLENENSEEEEETPSEETEETEETSEEDEENSDEKDENFEEEEENAEDEETETNFERENALEAFSGEAAEWLAQNHGDISAEDLEAMSDEDLEALWNEYQSSLENENSEEEEEDAEEGEAKKPKSMMEFLAEKGITGDDLRNMDPKKMMALLNEYDSLYSGGNREEEENSEDEESEKNFEREKALDFFSGAGADWLAENHGDISAEDLEAMSDEELEVLWNEYHGITGEGENSEEDEETERNYEREEVLEAFSNDEEAAEWLAQNHGEISAEDLETMSDEELEALWKEYVDSRGEEERSEEEGEEERKEEEGEEREEEENAEDEESEEERSAEDEESEEEERSAEDEEEERAEREVLTVVNAMAEEDARIAAGIIAEQAYNEEINKMWRFNPVRLWRQSRPGRSFRMKHYNAEAMDKLRSFRNGETPEVPAGFWNERDVIAKFTMAYMENLENEMVHSDAGEMMRGYTVRVGEDGTETVVHRRRNENGEIEEIEVMRRKKDGTIENLIEEEEGDESEAMERDARAAIETKDAIRHFAESGGTANDKNAFIAAIKKIKVETLGLTDNQSDFTMDNYLDAAVAARDKISHGIAMDRVLDGFNYINAESRSQVRTEVEKTNIDSVAAKIAMRTHGLIAPETAAAVVGFASGYLLTGTKTAVKAGIAVGGVALGAAVPAAIPLVAGALISGVWGGINEANRVKRDQSRTLRDMAMGSKKSTLNPSNPFMRGRLEYDEALRAANYDSQPANGLKEALNNAISAGKTDEIMKQLAAIDSRIKISDQQGIDLISYTSGESIVNERANLDIARARARIALREAGINPAECDTYSDAYASSVESINKNVSDTKKVQGKLRRRRATVHGLKAAAISAVASIVGQEVRAAFDDNVVGAFESDSANNVGARRTVLGDIFSSPDDPKIGIGQQLTDQQISDLRQEGYTVAKSGAIPGGTNEYDIQTSSSEFAGEKGFVINRSHFGNGTGATDFDEGRTYRTDDQGWFTGFKNEITDGRGGSRDWREVVESGRVRAYFTPEGVSGGKAIELNVTPFTDASGMPQISITSDIPEIQAALDKKLGMVEIAEYMGTNADGTVNANIFSTWPGSAMTGDITEHVTEQLPDIPVYSVTSPERAVDFLHPVVIPMPRTEAGPSERGTGHTKLDSLNPVEKEEREEEEETESEEESGSVGSTGTSGTGQNNRGGNGSNGNNGAQGGQNNQNSQNRQSGQTAGQNGQTGQNNQTGQTGQNGQNRQTGQNSQNGQNNQTGQNGRNNQTGQNGRNGQNRQTGQNGQNNDRRPRNNEGGPNNRGNDGSSERRPRRPFRPSRGEIIRGRIDDIANELGKPFESPRDRGLTLAALKFWNKASDEERKNILSGKDKTSSAARWALQYLLPRGFIEMEPTSE